MTDSHTRQQPRITFLSRTTCGSCQRVYQQITPIIEAYGLSMDLINIDEDNASMHWAIEYGDRIPVLLINDEEFACWEVDNEELFHELQRWHDREAGGNQ